ncbi:Hypothetical protein DAL_22 [Psychrobacter phage D'Alembert]|nr:Hypothetical protein DAL_22 [Psychrobacter phage D'Alembert]
MPNSAVSESNVTDKKWNEDVLITGGCTYFYPTKIDNVELKDKYRVSMTYKREHTKKLKYKIKVASGEIFSVAAKTMGEAQAVVNELYGKRMYRVSQELV